MSCLLILAAGQSRRYGSDKRFVDMPKGGPLLPALIRRAAKAGLEVYVVLRANERALAAQLHAHCIFSDRASGGMGFSLADAITQLPADSGSVLVMPTDLPLIRIGSIRAVAAAASRQRIVLPQCAGVRGHPVAIGEAFWPELSKLEGDIGARKLIERHPDCVDYLSLDDPGICADGDTPAQMQKLFSHMAPPMPKA